MALVEGFGDEVIQFFGILFVVVLIVLLWMSTQVAEMQIFRGAVFILERRTRRRHHDTTRAAPLVPNQSISEQSATETVPLNDVIQTNSTLSNDNPENKNDNPVATKSDVTEQFNESSQSNDTNDIDNEPQIYEDSIRIRLKYLNDNCRLVQGRLQETIGVFKRRHFTNELTSHKIIRLIFQGKVLHDDEASLSSCGLHDNCVVHCLIHQPRPTANAQQTPDPVNQDTAEQPLPNTIRHGHRQPGGPVQREWNLATLLSALITIIISLLWYARIQFYTLFSYTSTGTLAILTAIFLFTAFLTYLVDSEEQQHHLPQLRHN
ncbi:transmembrane and ubiquitin-like domain-containing protein 1 [Acyrthosiphon pisum]|uniref:Ubiquitin-like domain-containing protein n=1 Tax=Acyrthosiphon pisum TaxID=7029 RepID=A0A8R2B1G5_ACYPI|nr:transmembrane and ubiquitin-like domain-containing protein 1 [Acyrthosiphon pisum]XP_016657625.1 transmembrane and ubiquitin-like domain-containing protein 1 [Acyrthosiphon pisum]|eukprot:XP_008179811.1 PREDICTED: transmembrane and ubiquitin-like domain-containing protein 1 [Acyrthosiphon pisum]